MNNLKKKKRYTTEQYVKSINSELNDDYEMLMKQTFNLVPFKIAGKEFKLLKKKVSVNKPVIRHKTCGNIFWTHRDVLLKKKNKGLELCPYCSKHIYIK